MSLSRLIVATVLVVWLAGCGFHPLYGERDTGRVDDALAQVKIALIPDRLGQQLYNDLRDSLNPTGQPRRPRYILEVKLVESIEELAIRKDETATRANLNLFAEFQLRTTTSGEVVMSGRSLSTTSYNILSSEFATVSAEGDARRRAVRVLGDDIKTRLGLYFQSRPGAGA